MKRYLVGFIMLVAFNSHAQDLPLRINMFYSVITNTTVLELDYISKVSEFVSPVSKLNRDSIGSDYYSYWNAQFNVNNKFKSFKINKIEYSGDTSKATVFVDQSWNLDGLGDYIYQIKSEWVKYNNNWYLSDKPSKNISIQPYYEDNQK